MIVSPNGPIALNDRYLLAQRASFNRERIPERQPHTNGSGAFGTFETAADVSKYTNVKIFQQGAKCEVVMRFSTVAGESGSPDT